jgi:hypothetical protein
MTLKNFYLPALLFLIGLKLFIVSNIAVHIRFSPIDDSLYVTRAYEFLSGNGWGNYDAYVLAKLPGISLWLAGSRQLGIPYLLGLNILYSLAGFLLIKEVAKLDVHKPILFIAYFIYLFNPITFSVEWALVMREALGTVVTVTLLAVSLRILLSLKNQLPIGSIAAWIVLFTFGQILREEDRLLWVYFALFLGGIFLVQGGLQNRTFLFRFGLLMLVTAILSTSLVSYGVRLYNQKYYGAPLMNDFNEGEFPKLMATLRSIESSVDNRLVMLPQEVIKKLIPIVPDFAPVLERLPSPGLQTFSCKLQGVCTEWGNGWMPWVVKKAAAEVGRTPTLNEGQNYFKSIRIQIEALCASGELRCRPNGDGILPPMQLRWFRAYLQSLVLLIEMTTYPAVDVIASDVMPVNAARSLVEIYQQVTMTHVTQNPKPSDAQREISKLQSQWRITIAPFIFHFNGLIILLGSTALVWRLVMYPSVKVGPLYIICAVFWTYSFVRLLALAYVAVFFGPFEPRMIFSSHIGLGVLSIFAIWDLFQARKKYYLRR